MSDIFSQRSSVCYRPTSRLAYTTSFRMLYTARYKSCI